MYTYFLVSYTLLRQSALFSFNSETLDSGANSPLQTLFIRFDVALATFTNLLYITIFKERLDGHRKGKLEDLSYVPMLPL